MGFSPLKRRLFHRHLTIGALIFVAYYLLAKAGLQLATLNKSTSPVWPASGVAIALLSRAGRKYWPAIALGAFVANFESHIQPVAILGMTIGNTLEGLVGSFLFDRVARGPKAFFGAQILLAVFFAAVIATPVSATLGTGILYFVGAIGSSQLKENWLTWWTGDTLGVLLFAPFFLRIFSGRFTEHLPSLRGIGIALFSAGVAYFIFLPGVPMVALFFIYPVLLFAVCTAQPGESGFITLIFAGAAIWRTINGYGPFNIGSTNANLICLALFLASIAITEQGLQFVREVGNFRLSMGVLISGWMIGAFLLHAFNRNEELIDHSRFQKLVDGAMAQCTQRTILYEAALRSGVGLFRATNHVTLTDWKAYIDAQDIHRNYPGILGIGYAERVPKKDIAPFVERVRSEGNPDFRIHGVDPKGELKPATDQDRFVIVSVEPRAQNRAAIGLDLTTEANRYEGALRAARTGLPEITQPIRLVQDDRSRVGFVLFMPIFTAERVFGWVYAPLVIEEFLGTLSSSNAGEIAYELDIVGEKEGRQRIYSDAMETVETRNQVPFETAHALWGETLYFRWYRTTKFQSRHDTTSAWVIFGCALLNILICSFATILTSTTRKANELARRQADEIRAQQAKLEHSSRLATLGEMAGGIAHEINNPLAILAGRALILTRLADSGEVKPEMIRQNADKITETIERMAKIIRGLRSFSRNGERDPFREVEVSKIFSSTLDFCSERFRNQQIDLRIDGIPEGSLICREVQIVQILLNLLNNAFDAVLPAGERWISLEARILSSEVQFVVTDSGPGIPPAVAQNMMTPFFTTKPVGQGTGLGLSISSGIAEEHGGTLRYIPKDGHTRFVLSISRTLA